MLIFFFNSVFHELVWLNNLIEIHRLFQSYCESHVVWCNIIRQAFVEVKKNEGYDRTSHYKLFPMCLYITLYQAYFYNRNFYFLTLDFTNMITIFLVLRQKLQSFILRSMSIVSWFTHPLFLCSNIKFMKRTHSSIVLVSCLMQKHYHGSICKYVV